MGTRVKIMGLEVDLLTQETLEHEIAGYLANDYLNVVHMISLDYIDTYDENELVQNELKEADMVLPGERAILSAHHVDVLETGGMAVNYQSVFALVEPLELAERSFYFILRNEKEAKTVSSYWNRHFPKEKNLGVCIATDDTTEESIVNDINMKLPDIVVLSMDSTQQEEWISRNKARLNAKLCLVCGSIMPMILKENVHVPVVLRRLHLGGFYRMFVRFPYTHFFRRRIFKQKMEDYITKKKLER